MLVALTSCERIIVWAHSTTIISLNVQSTEKIAVSLGVLSKVCITIMLELEILIIPKSNFDNHNDDLHRQSLELFCQSLMTILQKLKWVTTQQL